ncbi:unnamed protein product [Schistosoma turkestanicum]|nr:unnamed protein product [Schistosoma turkestanicum]
MADISIDIKSPEIQPNSDTLANNDRAHNLYMGIAVLIVFAVSLLIISIVSCICFRKKSKPDNSLTITKVM